MEKPLLGALAKRTPRWVTPDILTVIGVLGAALCCLAYWLSRYDPIWLWVSSLGLLINWYGDSLDGTLARYRKIERPRYGFFLDHTVDAFDEMLIVLGIGLCPYVRFDLAALTLIAYLMLTVYVYVRTVVQSVFKISYGPFGPTEMRAVIALMNAVMFFWVPAPKVNLPFGTFTVYDLFATSVAGILLIVFLVSTLRTARELAALEPPPSWDSDSDSDS